MKLTEHEGKSILRDAGITVPTGILLRAEDGPQALNDLAFPVMVKAQVLSGGRGKGNLIRGARTPDEAIAIAQELRGQEHNGEEVQEILVEEKVLAGEEAYLAIMFSTRTRTPVLVLSRKGGIDVEAARRNAPEAFVTIPIDPLRGLGRGDALAAMALAGIGEPAVAQTILSAYQAFLSYHARLIEINPLAIGGGACVALDAKIALDDASLKANPRQFPPRTGGRAATQREIAARAIDAADHRGAAGRSFVDLDGDIAVLASGGGASLTCMDALLAYGGAPANYVEYSGNPVAQKVRDLTRVTLSRLGLCGCWIVGGTANFTRIDETFKGIIEALEELDPKYPIVVRRAGPGDKEAFAMLNEAARIHGWDVRTYGEELPMTESARIIADAAAVYRRKAQEAVR